MGRGMGTRPGGCVSFSCRGPNVRPEAGGSRANFACSSLDGYLGVPGCDQHVHRIETHPGPGLRYDFSSGALYNEGKVPDANVRVLMAVGIGPPAR